MYEIIISKINNSKKILIIDDGNIVEQYDENLLLTEKIGNIYNGKIKDIQKGLGAAFVDIGANKNVFMHIKDIANKNNIKIGQNILVQVKKEETIYKSAKVSNKNISVTGKYVVLLPNVSFITVSKKITDENERNRLKLLVKKYIPSNMGAIIRTCAESKNDEIIEKDINKLMETWKKIIKDKYKEPKLIYNEDSLLKKILIDLVGNKISKIVVEDYKDYIYVNDIINQIEEKIEVLINENVSKTYNVKEMFEKLEKKKIWLKCGGFIIIEKTEALTTIDVNSGKYIGKKDLSQTILKVNKEATEEIAKQLRLRDMSGIIIVDYIDMDNKEDKEIIKDILNKEIKKDRSRVQVYDFTQLNLLEITRKQMYSHSY